MSKLSLRRLCLAAIITCGALATAGGASAVIMPTPTVPAASSAAPVLEVASRRYGGPNPGSYRHPRRFYGHHPYYRHRHYGYRRPGYDFYFGGWWYEEPWWQSAAPPLLPQAEGSAHVSWCLHRYRSYNPATDLFFGFDGRYHRCRSPYRP